MILLVVSTLLVNVPSGTVCEILERGDIVCKTPDNKKYLCIKEKKLCLPIKREAKNTV